MRSTAWLKKKKILAGGIGLAGILLAGFTGNSYESRNSTSSRLSEWVVPFCTPLFSFGIRQEGRRYEDLFTQVFLQELPVFSYVWEHDEDNLFFWENWQEIENKPEEVPEAEIDEASIAEDGEKETLTEEPLDLQEALEKENQMAKDAAESVSDNDVVQETFAGAFLPHEKQAKYNLTEYQDFAALFETFYAMDSHTMIGSEQLNLGSLLEPDMTVNKEAEGPQILIYHTHSQEGFADSVPGDASTTIVGAGEKLAQILTQEYGYHVLHHRGEYDVEDRDSAYSRSLPALEQLLSENPTIQLVIDLHRDGVGADRRLVVDLDGRPTAQFMFFNGLSRTKNTGDIAYLKNPYQAENLALSFQMQLASNEYYPGLARKIYLNGYRYNMHLRRSMLIELGAQTNTVEEAMNAVEPLAHVLNLVLSGEAEAGR